MKSTVLLCVVALALQTVMATAHHAISAVYDASRKVTVEVSWPNFNS